MHINLNIQSHHKTNNNFPHMICKLFLPLCKICNVRCQSNNKANRLRRKRLIDKKQRTIFYPPKQIDNLYIIYKFLLQFRINSNLLLLFHNKHSAHYNINLFLSVNKIINYWMDITPSMTFYQFINSNYQRINSKQFHQNHKVCKEHPIQAMQQHKFYLAIHTILLCNKRNTS